MDMPDPEAEFLRVSALLLKKGVKLQDVYPKSLTQILGGSGSSATVYFLGNDAFSDPRILLERMKTMFGRGTPVLLSKLVDRANELLRGGS
jgi:hypothetical protein